MRFKNRGKSRVEPGNIIKRNDININIFKYFKLI